MGSTEVKYFKVKDNINDICEICKEREILKDDKCYYCVKTNDQILNYIKNIKKIDKLNIFKEKKCDIFNSFLENLYSKKKMICIYTYL